MGRRPTARILIRLSKGILMFSRFFEPTSTRPCGLRIALASSVLLAAASLAPTPALATPNTPAQDVTPQQREKERLDAVDIPKLEWADCDDGVGQCTTYRVPLDYDEPQGEQVELAVRKLSAGDPDERIGALFLNPGGPGGSGQDIVRDAGDLLSAELLERFDVIGLDPRGTNGSSPLTCYDDAGEEAADVAELSEIMPASGEAAEFTDTVRALGRECADDSLAASMSTAQVARDMEVLRRSLDESTVSFLGWSYGTYVGQTYRAMFPGSVRAVALDGVVDPAQWLGRRQGGVPMTVRSGVADGQQDALDELLDACAASAECGLEDPHGTFERVMSSLDEEPLVITEGDATQEVTLGAFLHQIRLAMHDPSSVSQVPAMLAEIDQLLHERDAVSDEAVDPDASAHPEAPDLATGNPFAVNAAVMCSEGRHPQSLDSWNGRDRSAHGPGAYVQRYWLWQSAACAGEAWTIDDEDAYTGGFAVPSDAPVLVVGSRHDPATPYAAAVAVAERTPNAALVTSDTWGHTAYGHSRCATAAVDAYLLSADASAADTECPDEKPPFEG